jgi:hypothetical protein
VSPISKGSQIFKGSPISKDSQIRQSKGV